MKTLIVYYSRSGLTRSVALALAHALNAVTEEITEPRSRSGFFGYLRSAREAMRKQPATITPTRDPSPYDLVLVGTPVWVGSLSSPVRAYLTANRDRLKDVAFFCTMGGRGDAVTFAQMQQLIGKAPVGQLTVTDREITSGGHRYEWVGYVPGLEKPHAYNPSEGYLKRIEAFAATFAPVA